MTVSVRDGSRTITLQVNDLGVIDATDFFNTERFMRGGPQAWTLDRAQNPIEALSLHHWAGWRLPANATLQQEFDMLIRVALFHRNEARGRGYGIGPAYWYCGFASSRVWAVGKFGTHRASVAGRSPQSLAPWNDRMLAHAQAGNFEVDPLTPGDANALITSFTDMYNISSVSEDTPIYEHGLTPTANASGVIYSQSTACPGRNIATFRAQGKLIIPGIGESHEPDRFNEGFIEALKLLKTILQPGGIIANAVSQTLDWVESQIKEKS